MVSAVCYNPLRIKEEGSDLPNPPKTFKRKDLPLTLSTLEGVGIQHVWGTAIARGYKQTNKTNKPTFFFSSS